MLVNALETIAESIVSRAFLILLHVRNVYPLYSNRFQLITQHYCILKHFTPHTVIALGLLVSLTVHRNIFASYTVIALDLLANLTAYRNFLLCIQ